MTFDPHAAYEAIKQRAIAARIPISTLCVKAGVSPSAPVHWAKRGIKPSITSIGNLERALDAIEAERAS